MAEMFVFMIGNTHKEVKEGAKGTSNHIPYHEKHFCLANCCRLPMRMADSFGSSAGGMLTLLVATQESGYIVNADICADAPLKIAQPKNILEYSSP